MASGERVVVDVPARVFVTGAGGFIGQALIGRLRELGAEVRGVDAAPGDDPSVRGGSTLHPQEWSDALAGVDAVIHAAAVVSTAAPLARSWEVNVLGTRRVLTAAEQAGVGRFLHISSIAAYGTSFTGVVDEQYPVRVEGGSYVDTKVNGEAVVLAAHAAGEIPCTIVRPGDIFGPGSIWVREPVRMLRSHQMILPAGGQGLFCPTYVDNLVDGILLALSSPAGSGQIFNLTDGVSMPALDYFRRLSAMVGGTVRPIPTTVALPLSRLMGAGARAVGWASEANPESVSYLARRGTYSIEKARRLLGYDPRVSFDEGMSAVEDWLRAEGIL